ncbi:MAG: hypothetical protein KGZ80_09845 [Methylomonas sp.]|nr:hypothetical protein [Methylomonas sp.]PPD25359.1 MAG: hypothetical protein CTY22_09075 [Methylomonas sp.]PPD35376.1 MAG: hypothetical protein CTY21_09075 [Methylomonas sp.]PPD38344.1 MAG: hypothetical protein CTY17_09610 [Methylomonas sp.]PPD52383.1 MAG: hypothetical protein CTY11_09200 [Methylomonas sp.]
MNSVLEVMILQRVHCLDEAHKAEVLDFVEYLSAKESKNPDLGQSLQEIDPLRDLAQFIGNPAIITEDGVTFQRRIRDAEWR